MKQLQNNFTTPEQSKRLLELGVPADSADCYWNDMCVKPIPMQQGILYSDKRNQFGKVNVPIWSVGRLLAICKMCEPKKDYEQLCDEMKYCENLCVLIISHIIANLPIINFSKLEDWL